MIRIFAINEKQIEKLLALQMSIALSFLEYLISNVRFDNTFQIRSLSLSLIKPS